MTVTNVIAETRVLDALDQPRTTREIYQQLLLRVWGQWCENEGMTLELGEDGMPEPVVRLLSYSWARKEGCHVGREQVYRVLRKLEADGRVTRLQVPSARSILWVRSGA